MKQEVYRALAGLVQAMANCEKAGNTEWYARHKACAESICCNLLPSGSGIDNGTTVDFDASKPERLVLTSGFRHMDEHGGYDGWSNHSVIVRPSLQHGIDVRITGRNRNDIKDYLGEVYQESLSQMCDTNDYYPPCDVEDYAPAADII